MIPDKTEAERLLISWFFLGCINPTFSIAFNIGALVVRVGFRVICVYIYMRERERYTLNQTYISEYYIRVYDFTSRLGCMDGNAEQE